MSVYNSAAIAETMNVGVSNVTGTTAENVTATESYNQVVNNGGQYIKNPRDILINNTTGRTLGGLEISVNSDGTINVSGTATDNNRNIMFYSNSTGAIPTTVNASMYQKIPRGKYICGPSPAGSEANKYIMSMRYGSAIDGNTRLMRIPSGETIVIDNTTGDFDYCLIYFTVWVGIELKVVLNPYLKKV